MSKFRRIYISRSNHIPDELLLEFVKQLHEWFPNANIAYHNREEKYDPTVLAAATMVIIFVGNAKIPYYSVVGIGTHNEIIRAAGLGIPCHLAYKRVDNTTGLWNFNFSKLHNATPQKHSKAIFLNYTLTSLESEYSVVHENEEVKVYANNPTQPEESIDISLLLLRY